MEVRSKKVSIVVPVYNMERFLEETLESVLRTDYEDFEVVVWDDGSKDGSYGIAERYAERDARVRIFRHANMGVSGTRNRAIGEARGEYILPVDADNTIEPNFVKEAVKLLEARKKVMLVAPRSDFFGGRTGEWKLPQYSFRLLARKNIIDNCAMYRKKDWERVGGYCEDIATREDWDFWISMLKDGGEVAVLPFIAHHYRIREDSKRVTHRGMKNKVIDKLNERHLEAFVREFGGPLRYNRTWSKLINGLSRIFVPMRVVLDSTYEGLRGEMEMLHWRWIGDYGKVVYAKRNELREVEIEGKIYIIKRYAVPNIINRVVYVMFRPSKAARAYDNSKRFLESGIDTPKPVGYVVRRCGLLLKESYFVSEKSDYRYTFNDVSVDKRLEGREDYLRAVGKVTARMHEAGYYPLDFSGGNLLLDIRDGRVVIQQVDLNRMSFGNVDMEKGCKGFARLDVEGEGLEIMARNYAQERGFDEARCVELVKTNRWKKILPKENEV